MGITISPTGSTACAGCAVATTSAGQPSVAQGTPPSPGGPTAGGAPALTQAQLSAKLTQLVSDLQQLAAQLQGTGGAASIQAAPVAGATPVSGALPATPAPMTVVEPSAVASAPAATVSSAPAATTSATSAD